VNVASLFKALVRFNIQSVRLANEAGARAELTPEEARKITRLNPSTVVDKRGVPTPGTLWDETLRQSLIASAVDIKEQRAVMDAQMEEELAALRVESPHTLPPIRDVDIAQEQADQVMQGGK